MKKLLLIPAALLCAPLLARAEAPDAIAAKAATCQACHGPGGNKPIDPSYPKIGGQHKDYLVHALREYHSGRRKNPIMGAQAAALGSDDIEQLAAYFASQQGQLTVPR